MTPPCLYARHCCAIMLITIHDDAYVLLMAITRAAAVDVDARARCASERYYAFTISFIDYAAAMLYNIAAYAAIDYYADIFRRYVIPSTSPPTLRCCYYMPLFRY